MQISAIMLLYKSLLRKILKICIINLLSIGKQLDSFKVNSFLNIVKLCKMRAYMHVCSCG